MEDWRLTGALIYRTDQLHALWEERARAGFLFMRAHSALPKPLLARISRPFQDSALGSSLPLESGSPVLQAAEALSPAPNLRSGGSLGKTG